MKALASLLCLIVPILLVTSAFAQQNNNTYYDPEQYRSNLEQTTTSSSAADTKEQVDVNGFFSKEYKTPSTWDHKREERGSLGTPPKINRLPYEDAHTQRGRISSTVGSAAGTISGALVGSAVGSPSTKKDIKSSSNVRIKDRDINIPVSGALTEQAMGNCAAYHGTVLEAYCIRQSLANAIVEHKHPTLPR